MTALKEQYFQFSRQLLTSPAWWVLNLNERRAFDCIMRAHQQKAGYVYDGLEVTRRDFVRDGGIPPKHVTSALRVLQQLGIIECTRNLGGSVSGRTPNMWRPTFLPRTPESKDAAPHDYLKIKTREEAKRIALLHRVHETRKHRPPPAPALPAVNTAIRPASRGARLISVSS